MPGHMPAQSTQQQNSHGEPAGPDCAELVALGAEPVQHAPVKVLGLGVGGPLGGACSRTTPANVFLLDRSQLAWRHRALGRSTCHCSSVLQAPWPPHSLGKQASPVATATPWHSATQRFR